MAETHAVDEAQGQVRARSQQLQLRFLEILNAPADRWAEQPCIAAHAIAQTLGRVLAAIVTADGTRVPLAMDLLDYVRQHVTTAAAIAAGPTPGETRH